jgi:large subunit ribosomal protein L31
MKEGIHPNYHQVVFQDSSTGVQFLTRSTIRSERTCVVDGTTYPLVMVDISSASHPFFTGKQKFVDAAGRVEMFQRKYKWGQKDADKSAAADK